MNAATLRKMRDLGLSLDEAIELAETWEAADGLAVPMPSAAALRQRRFRARQRDCDVTRDVTSDAPLSETKVPPTPPSKTQPIPDPPKPPLRGSKGSRRCPESWSPKPTTLAVLEAEGHTAGDLERALTRMRDHEFRSARTDWDATFRNWVRNDADRAPRKAHERPHPDAKLAAKQANYARAWEGSERAARFRDEP